MESPNGSSGATPSTPTPGEKVVLGPPVLSDGEAFRRVLHGSVSWVETWDRSKSAWVRAGSLQNVLSGRPMTPTEEVAFGMREPDGDTA